MIDPTLLQILCCPETRQSLEVATPQSLQRVNERIKEGQVKNRAEQRINDSLEGLLVRKDGLVGYPIRHGIPVLLSPEAIILG